ncbi:MAG: DUF1488 family protein [Candidatus Sedimenticola sp. 6PFRAG5]
MQLNRRRVSITENTVIQFPGYESWNSMTSMATVAADVDKERILCRISLEILEEKFGTLEDPPMRSLVSHRAAIQVAARKLIENAAFEEDGSILIRSGDI